MFKLDLEKAKEPEIKLPTSIGSLKKQKSSRKKTSISALLTMPKPLTGWIKTVENSSRDRIPDHLNCLLRNLYAGQEATVRTGHGTTDLFQIRKGVHQSCLLSPWLFNLSAEYIMRNAGLEKAQAGIKIAGRNLNNFRYADDSILMAEIEEELKSLWMRVKEESEKKKKNWLKTQQSKKLRLWHLVPITSWQIEGENIKEVTDFIFLGSKIPGDDDCSHKIKRCLFLRRLI